MSDTGSDKPLVFAKKKRKKSLNQLMVILSCTIVHQSLRNHVVWFEIPLLMRDILVETKDA